MDKQSRFKETKSSEGAFEGRDFYRESLSKLRLVRELQKVRHYKDLLYKENIDSGIESIEIPSPPRVPAFARETQPDIVVPSIKATGDK